MKTGKSLSELATEIERQRDNRQDFVAPTKQIALVTTSNTGEEQVRLRLGNALSPDVQAHSLRPIAHGQLAEYSGIPKPYYDLMLSQAPQLLADNVNTWLARKDEKRLVRVLDGNVRGILSDRYRPLDNYELAEVVLPVIQAQKLEIVSCEITERRLYIKAFAAGLAREIELAGHDVRKQDVCSPVICISNSEVGFGALSIIAGLFTKGCTNLAFFDDSKLRKYHIGKSAGDVAQLQEVLSDKTKRLTDAAVWSQVRDVVSSAFDPKRFDTLIERVQETTTQKIEGDVVKVVDLASDVIGLTKSEGKGVLKHLIEGGDLSRYGLFNAITRTAEDLGDYDRATEIERAGGKVIELPRNQWEALAEAA